MGASDYLSPLNYGQSTAGSAGAAETTSTLGTSPLDRSQPLTAYNTSHLQIDRMRALLLLISADSKGGTRSAMRVQTASPFGVGEYGHWFDTFGFMWKVVNGSSFPAGGPVASALDVASLGSSTTLLTLSPVQSGLYRVTISVSAHTNTDTVTATITYTDAVEAFATTLTPISAVALTHDSNTGTTSSTTIVRASAATNLVATLSVTTQTTTRASVVVERLI